MVLASFRRHGAATVTELALAAMTLPALAQALSAHKCTGNPDIPWAEQIVGCGDAIG
jgi:hypothetical protein